MKTNFKSLLAAAAKSLQLCLTLCSPIEGSPPGSPVLGILQARTLEWVAISFSNAWKWKVKVKSLSRVWLLATPWTAAYRAPLSMGFSRQEYWSECHCLLCKSLLRTYIKKKWVFNWWVVFIRERTYCLVARSYPTLLPPCGLYPPGSSVHGILQARTLEWVAISFSNSWKWKLKVKSLSLVWLLATPWTAAYQAPPSRCFSRQEYWIGVPLPSQGWHDDFLTMSVFLCCWLLTSDKSCKTFGETIYDNLLLLGSSAFRPIRYFDYDVSVLVHQF